jgi:transposase
LTARQRQLLKHKVREQSDVTLAELQQLLSDQESVDVHLSIISRALSSLTCRTKKILSRLRAQLVQAGLVLAARIRH